MGNKTKKVKNNYLSKFGLDKVFGFAIIKIVNPPCAVFGPCRALFPRLLIGRGFNFLRYAK
jgi:hypothetical protein